MQVIKYFNDDHERLKSFVRAFLVGVVDFSFKLYQVKVTD